MSDRLTDRAHLSFAVRAGGGDMVRVARNAGAQYFAVNMRAACDCVFVRFHNERAGAFAERDPVGMVKGRAGIFVQRVQRQKARVGYGRKCVRAPCDHDVRLTRADEVGSVSDGNRASCARVGNVRHHAARVHFFRNVVCYGRNRHFQHVLFFLAVAVITFKASSAADAAAHDNARARISVKIGKRGVFHRLVCCLQAKRGAAVERRIVYRWFLYFCGIVRIAVFGVERAGVVDSAFRSENVCPAFFHIVADRAHDAEPRDHASDCLLFHMKYRFLSVRAKNRVAPAFRMFVPLCRAGIIPRERERKRQAR